MNTRSAQLVIVISPHTIIDPPPNRTLENKQQERKCSFSSSNHFDPTIISKKSKLTNLDVLEKNTYTQSLSCQHLCLLANCNLLLLLRPVSRGTLTGHLESAFPKMITHCLVRHTVPVARLSSFSCSLSVKKYESEGA